MSTDAFYSTAFPTIPGTPNLLGYTAYSPQSIFNDSRPASSVNNTPSTSFNSSIHSRNRSIAMLHSISHILSNDDSLGSTTESSTPSTPEIHPSNAPAKKTIPLVLISDTDEECDKKSRKRRIRSKSSKKSRGIRKSRKHEASDYRKKIMLGTFEGRKIVLKLMK
ncbi:Negative Effect on Gut development [Caenorhabditis elegans]|nr:Negative Effect on Gut development [Caenorhabditis elegans]CCD68486.1 Negative Effect on Gut development [Caenorhabditis elegans]|eukprot:NP_001256037.1 Negative Effect on Gut development [Caenorhabditis elegans]